MTNRAMNRATYMLTVALIFGCGKSPEPLGKLPRDRLADWAADCDAPIVEEPSLKGKDPMMVGKRRRELTFQKATRRYLCRPPGWSVYVDASERIVGLCVDNKLWPNPIEEHLQRAAPLIAKHMGEELAEELTKGTCRFEPESVGHGLIRWKQDLPNVVKPDGTVSYHPNVGTLQACCWELDQ